MRQTFASGPSCPESLPWVPRLLGFQVASLLRVVQSQGGMPGMPTGNA